MGGSKPKPACIALHSCLGWQIALDPQQCEQEVVQVEEVSVSGSRYWPQRVFNDGAGDALDALYRTHTLFVQRKSGALSYVDDPSGVRSLLSTAFHKVLACYPHPVLAISAASCDVKPNIFPLSWRSPPSSHLLRQLCPPWTLLPHHAPYETVQLQA